MNTICPDVNIKDHENNALVCDEPYWRKRRVAVITLGCKVNQYESFAVMGMLREKGCRLVPFQEEADVYVINTCAVTARSDYQSRQLIRRAYRRNPAAAVVVTGCYAQAAPSEIEAMPEVALIAGNNEKMDIPACIEGIPEGRRMRVSSLDQSREFAFYPVGDFPGHTRAFLKIQDGCNAWCSYCIVPRVRGRSRSLPPEQALREVRRLGHRGYREIVLTGVHLGAYGADLRPATCLLDLLKAIEEGAAGVRIRLSSLEPAEVTDDLIRFAARSRCLCPHFHVPLQSGDDEILTAMGRAYAADAFRNLVDRIHERIPRAAIGIDVLTGFPGEDEESAQRTFRLIESLPVSHLHVFPYSKRPGTPAAAMARQVEEKVKKARAESLRRLGRRKKSAFARLQVGTETTVLVEGNDMPSGEMKGLTDNYLTVFLGKYDPRLVNRFVAASVSEEEDGNLRGTIRNVF